MENNQEQPEELLTKMRNHWLYHLMQLITFVFMGILGALVFGQLGIVLSEQIWDMEGVKLSDSASFITAGQLNGFRLIQVFASLGAFVIPVLMQSAMNREHLLDYSGLNEKPKLIYIGLSIGAILLAIPLMSNLAAYLNGLSLPESMKDIEELVRAEQQKVLALQENLMQGSGTWSFIINAIVIAVIPAIGEELFFRKGALKLLFNLTHNAHASIAISAFLFALVHNEVFNFLPIFGFGLLLGYFALWSGNIWVPILAHFLNNFIALTMVKLSKAYPEHTLFQEDYTYSWLFLAVCALVLFASCRWMYLHYKKEVA